MIDKAAISNPKTKYGAGKPATRHFITQRITGALNIAFLIFFTWFVVSVAGDDRAGLVETIRIPLVGLVLALLMVNVAIHMRIGMREVIEDYIDDHRLNALARTASTVFTLLVVAVTVGSIVKILFWG